MGNDKEQWRRHDGEKKTKETNKERKGHGTVMGGQAFIFLFSMQDNFSGLSIFRIFSWSPSSCPLPPQDHVFQTLHNNQWVSNRRWCYCVNATARAQSLKSKDCSALEKMRLMAETAHDCKQIYPFSLSLLLFGFCYLGLWDAASLTRRYLFKSMPSAWTNNPATITAPGLSLTHFCSWRTKPLIL